MATIGTALNIAGGALDADQAALDIVANNTANVNTPGYTLETPIWEQNDSVTFDGLNYGMGFRRAARRSETARRRTRFNLAQALPAAINLQESFRGLAGSALRVQQRIRLWLRRHFHQARPGHHQSWPSHSRRCHRFERTHQQRVE